MRKASGSPRRRERGRAAPIALPNQPARKRTPGASSKPNGKGGRPRSPDNRSVAVGEVRRTSERVVRGTRAATVEIQSLLAETWIMPSDVETGPVMPLKVVQSKSPSMPKSKLPACKL